MNERIKTLITESGGHNLAYEGRPGSYSYAFTDNSMEKFADLIVRECLDCIAKLHKTEYTDKPKLSGPGLAIASNIESHFDIYIEEDGRFVK